MWGVRTVHVAGLAEFIALHVLGWQAPVRLAGTERGGGVDAEPAEVGQLGLRGLKGVGGDGGRFRG